MEAMRAQRLGKRYAKNAEKMRRRRRRWSPEVEEEEKEERSAPIVVEEDELDSDPSVHTLHMFDDEEDARADDDGLVWQEELNPQVLSEITKSETETRLWVHSRFWKIDVDKTKFEHGVVMMWIEPTEEYHERREVCCRFTFFVCAVHGRHRHVSVSEI